MRKLLAILGVFSLILLGASWVSAAVDLQEYVFNFDGNVSTAVFPPSLNSLSFNNNPVTGSLNNGLGTLTFTTNSPGDHFFIAYFDHEIDQETNTFLNEFGTANGSPAAGQTWQLDDPYGTIYPNATGFSNLLDSQNYVGIAPQDVSMALGWGFNVEAGQTAHINLLVASTAPTSGFYLQQTDPDSQANIFYSGTLSYGDGEKVPEPATMLLLGGGLAVLIGFRKKFRK